MLMNPAINPANNFRLIPRSEILRMAHKLAFIELHDTGALGYIGNPAYYYEMPEADRMRLESVAKDLIVGGANV
jgi:hypothetical protein